MPLRAQWHPLDKPKVEGLRATYGRMWIGWYNDDRRGEIGVTFKCPAPDYEPVSHTHFAILNVHCDGVEILRELERIGFMDKFEAQQASTFYDVLYCLASCGIAMVSHDTDDTLIPRAIYEILHEGE